MIGRWLVLALGVLLSVGGTVPTTAMGQNRVVSSPPPLLEPLDRLGDLLLGRPPRQQPSQHVHSHDRNQQLAPHSVSRDTARHVPAATRPAGNETLEHRVASTADRAGLLDAILGRQPVEADSASSGSSPRSAGVPNSHAVRDAREGLVSSSSRARTSADVAPRPVQKDAAIARHSGAAEKPGQEPANRSTTPSERPKLYQRLEALTESPFADRGEEHAAPGNSAAPEPGHDHHADDGDREPPSSAPPEARTSTADSATPATATKPEAVNKPQSDDSVAEESHVPHLAVRSVQPTDGAPTPTLAQGGSEQSLPPNRATRPTVANPTPKAETAQAQPGRPEMPTAPGTTAAIQDGTGTHAAGADDDFLPASVLERGSSASAAAALEPGKSQQPSSNVLLTQRAPALKVEATGPATISVGSKAVYQVRVINSGTVDAQAIVVRVLVPSWASIERTEAAHGSTTIQTEAASGLQQIAWEIAQLGTQQETTLLVHLIPREGRPLQLLVDWNYKRAPVEAVIQVQEPKLELALHGPEEVHCGQTASSYVLEVRNVGTGSAEQVTVAVAGDGAGQVAPARHVIERLLAGQSKQIELELIARRSGVVTIEAHAESQGAQHTHLVRRVEVVQPELTLSIDAPPAQYAQTDVRYRVDVSNAGSAAARDIRITVTLPPEAELVGADELGEPDEESGRICWQLGELAPGDRHTVTATCRYAEPAVTTLKVRAEAAEQVATEAEAIVRIEGFTDLGLVLNDPKKPVAVGAEAEYEVVVENRGTQPAAGVDLVVFFSQGIEPVSAEGAGHIIAPGQVVFDSIESLAPGQKHTFRVVAQAETPGNHVCRAEVTCKRLEIRLVRDEVTRFYAAGVPGIAERLRQAAER